MANLYGLDAIGNAAYVKATGAGSNADPYVVQNDLVNTGLKSAFVATTSGVDVVAAVGAAKLRVLSMAITAVSGCTVKLQRAGSSDMTPPFHLDANGNLTLSNPLGLFETAVNEKINAVVSGAVAYTVFLNYREIV